MSGSETDVVAHFRLLRRLGAGAMGVVYLAEDMQLGRQVALKLLPPAKIGDQRRTERLMREARAAAAVRHPAVATVLEILHTDEQIAIAMEYVEGETLTTLIHKGRFDVDRCLGVAKVVAEVLQRAHDVGIIHRDLKPDNVMLTPEGRVKLIDFGIAKSEGLDPADTVKLAMEVAEGSPRLTLEGDLIGTPGYMAPEQATGADIDGRADVFSLGVLMYEMLTGRNAFGGAKPIDIVVATIRQSPEHLSDVRHGLPLGLMDLVHRCMAKRPEDRPATARDVTKAIEQVHKEMARVGQRHRNLHLLGWGLAAAVTAVAVVAVTWPSTSDRSAPSPTTRYVSRQITANPSMNPVNTLALSPDGERLAWADTDGGLYVARLPDAEPRRLEVSPDHSVRDVEWCSDGTLVITEVPRARRLGETVTSTARLWVHRLAAGERSPIGRGTDPLCAPDATRLAVTTADGVRVGPLGREGAVIWRSEGTRKMVRAIGWSADGRRLGLLERFPGAAAARVLTVDADDGADPATVYVDEGGQLFTGMAPGGVSWLPTGEIAVALTNALDEPFGARIVAFPVDAAGRPNGASREIVRWYGAGATVLRGARDGTLGVVRVTTQTDVWVAELDEDGARVGDGRRLTLDDRDDRPSAFSVDSRSLLFTSDRSAGWQAYRQALDESRAERLSGDQLWQTWPTPTPDGDALLTWRLQARGGEDAVATLVRSAAGSEAHVLRTTQLNRPLRQRGRPEPEPQLSVSCATVAGGPCLLRVLGTRDAASALSLLDPVTGETNPLAAPAALYWAALSHEGDAVAMLATIDEALTVLVVDLASNAQRRHRLPARCGDSGRFAWLPGRRALILPCGGHLERLDLLSGRWTAVWQDEGAAIYDPVVSPNGRRLAVAARSRTGDVWLLVPERR